MYTEIQVDISYFDLDNNRSMLVIREGCGLDVIYLDHRKAFDNIPHNRLLQKLNACVINHSVRCKGDSSTPSLVEFGVPQSFVLGPILFLLYTADILGAMQNRNLLLDLYADDTQVNGSCHPSEVRALQDGESACNVAVWMKSNRLQLSASKTEVLWCAHPRRLHQLPDEPLRIGCYTVQPAQPVRDLDIFVDGGLTMAIHVLNFEVAILSRAEILKENPQYGELS